MKENNCCYVVERFYQINGLKIAEIYLEVQTQSIYVSQMSVCQLCIYRVNYVSIYVRQTHLGSNFD